jgi:hypothetical protein
MVAGTNTAKRNEAKDSLLRLLFGGVAIALAPIFIRFLLFLNNSFINVLLNASNGGLDDLLGNQMISNVRTGNAIVTALVISMFVYLFVKLNIKFIIREFTIIVFVIFTPIIVRTLDNKQKCNWCEYLVWSNTYKHIYAVYFLFLIPALSVIPTQYSRLGSNTNMGNDAITFS